MDIGLHIADPTWSDGGPALGALQELGSTAAYVFAQHTPEPRRIIDVIAPTIERLG